MLAGALVGAAVPGAAFAQLPERLSIDIVPRVGYSTNPFLLSGDTDSPFIELGITSRYVIVEETAETALTGRLNASQYLRLYGLSSGYGADLSHRRRLSDRIDVFAAAQLDSSVLGERQALFVQTPRDPQRPDIIDEAPLDVDATLVGRRQRRTAYGANAGLNVRPNERELFSGGANFSRSTYSGDFIGADFRTYGANASYARSLSPLTQAGARFTVQRTNYDRNVGSATVYQPELTLSSRFNERWTLNGALGASFVRGETLGESYSSTGLAALLRSCYLAARSTFCAGAVRDATATGFGRVRTRTGLDLSYVYNLSELSSINVAAAYSRFGALSETLGGAEFWSTNANYRTRLSQRLFAEGGVSVRGLSDNLRNEKDFTGQVSIGYRLGDLR